MYLILLTIKKKYVEIEHHLSSIYVCIASPPLRRHQSKVLSSSATVETHTYLSNKTEPTSLWAIQIAIRILWIRTSNDSRYATTLSSTRFDTALRTYFINIYTTDHQRYTGGCQGSYPTHGHHHTGEQTTNKVFHDIFVSLK